jgi:hypothetical protein
MPLPPPVASDGELQGRRAAVGGRNLRRAVRGRQGESRMADDVTPVRMLLRYWSLKVPTPDGTASVSVHSYKCRTPAYGGTVNEEKIKDAFIGVSKKKIIEESGGPYPYVDAFVGKASPETFETVLALVYKYREAFVTAYGKTHTEPYKTCAKILGADARPEWILQTFCDKYMGLDCNGFVGNFVAKADHALKLKANSSIQHEFFHKKKSLRTSADEVQAKDLIIWSNFQHIASIDAGLNDEFLVCQSTAGGPQASRNSFVYHPKQKLFSIEPSPVKFVGKVHIVSVGLS